MSHLEHVSAHSASVRPSHFTFFGFLQSLASLLLAKCFSNSNTAPAHPHATDVAVYPALFTFAMPNILILIYEQHLVLCIWTVLFSCCCGYRTCEFFHSVLCFPYIIAFLLPPNLPSCLFFFLPSFLFLAFFLFS